MILLIAFDLSKLTDDELTALDVALFVRTCGAVRVSGVGPGPRKVVVDVPAEEERKAS